MLIAHHWDPPLPSPRSACLGWLTLGDPWGFRTVWLFLDPVVWFFNSPWRLRRLLRSAVLGWRTFRGRAGPGALYLAAWWPGARCGCGLFRSLGVANSAAEVALRVEHRSEAAMEHHRRGGGTGLPQIGIHGTTLACGKQANKQAKFHDNQ